MQEAGKARCQTQLLLSASLFQKGTWTEALPRHFSGESLWWDGVGGIRLLRALAQGRDIWSSCGLGAARTASEDHPSGKRSDSTTI